MRTGSIGGGGWMDEWSQVLVGVSSIVACDVSGRFPKAEFIFMVESRCTY